jgi:hypothetical protein
LQNKEKEKKEESRVPALNPKRAQKRLFSLASEPSSHGGSLRRGKRKCKRPFVPRRPLHIVLRSSKARGELSFLRHEKKVSRILNAQAQKHFVKLHEFVNVGNHLHIKVRANSRSSFQSYLRSITALIARKLTGARRGHSFGQFWDALAFTRVLRTSKEEQVLQRYFTANLIEVKFGREVREIFLGRVSFTPG